MVARRSRRGRRSEGSEPRERRAHGRGRTDAREAIERALLVEPMSAVLAHAAGEAMAHVTGATIVDAVVAASAAQRGDVISTSDPGDLAELAAYFGELRVLAV